VESGVAGEQGTKPGNPGVPTGDQQPTNERDNITEGGHGGVGIDDVPVTRTPGESASSEPDPSRAATRQGQSLGELTEDVSTSERAGTGTSTVANTDDPYSHEDANQQRSEKHSAG
jgi:hypothetical protein